MAWTPRNMKYWYDAIIDQMLANPELKAYEIAEKLNRHPATVRLVMKSDLFKAEYQRRRDEVNETLGNALKDDLLRIAKAGTGRILEQLEDPSKVIPLKDVAAITDSTLEKMGYGVPAGGRGGQAPVEVNINTVSADTLAKARGVLREVEETKRLAPPSPQVENQSGHTIDSHDYSEIEDRPPAPQEVPGSPGVLEGRTGPGQPCSVAEQEAEESLPQPESREAV